MTQTSKVLVMPDGLVIFHEVFQVGECSLEAYAAAGRALRALFATSDEKDAKP